MHTKAAEVFGNALVTRLGPAVWFDLNSDIVASGHNAADLLPMVESGSLTMCYFSTSYLADRVPEFTLLDMPFLLTDRVQAYAVLDGSFGQLLTDQLHARTGFRVLGFGTTASGISATPYGPSGHRQTVSGCASAPS